MKNYILVNLMNEEYQKFLICLTYESILNYLNDIQNEIVIKESAGTLLIDQLLVTGNSKNRFISCVYSNGKINLSSAMNVRPKANIKHITISYLRENPELVENSILPEYYRNIL